MVFSVRRTSTIGDDIPPCEGCQRVGPPPAEDDWGCLGMEVTWLKTFSSLDEILEFVNRNKRIVISNVDWRNEAYPLIEIYDSYRE